MQLWHVPPKSPDLNPAENFWSWLRRDLRSKDLADLRAGRPAISKFAFKARVRNLCGTQRAAAVARACARRLRKTCAEVVRKRGARARS